MYISIIVSHAHEITLVLIRCLFHILFYTQNQQIQNYSNCACIAESHPDVMAVPIATAGPCPQTCKAMVPFLIILFVVTLVVSITQVRR